jgi:superfamily II DNA or RNA helicase
MTLKPFQVTYIAAVASKIKAGLLARARTPAAPTRVVLLQSPTGSGKTVMAAHVLNDLAGDTDLRPVFLWLAPLTLHVQSLARLEGMALGSLNCYDATKESKRFLERGDVGFLNWASVNSTTPVPTPDDPDGEKALSELLRSRESNTFLSAFCAKTREEDRDIVLVIDESHHSAESANARAVIDLIGPTVILEMTATPSSVTGRKDFDLVKIEIPEVVEAQLIRKDILLNPGLDEAALPDAAAATFVQLAAEEELLLEALRKRDEITTAYQKHGRSINPLLLIQLPDAKTGEKMRTQVETLLRREGYSVNQGNVAAWLSNDSLSVKRDDPALIADNGAISVLIFKQAIAIGWDCPRAHILFKLRDPASKEAFKVQTVGRIMRMPEHHHYQDDVLDNAYVYSSHREYEKGMGVMDPTSAFVHWRSECSKPLLQCEYLDRSKLAILNGDDCGRAAAALLALLNITAGMSTEAARQQLGANGYSVTAARRAVRTGLLAENNADLHDGRSFTTSETIVEDRFRALVRNSAGPIDNPSDLLLALYDAFEDAAGLTTVEVQQLAISSFRERSGVERYSFAGLLKDAIESVTTGRKTRNLAAPFWWSPPDPLPISVVESRHEEVAAKKYAYDRCIMRSGRSNPEREFEEWLEGCAEVAWWAKNARSRARTIRSSPRCRRRMTLQRNKSISSPTSSWS